MSYSFSNIYTCKYMYIGTNYSVAGFEFSLFLLSNEKYLINALTDDIIKQKTA